MRTPESIGEEIREYIKWSSTYFLHYHDKEGRTTEGKALFLGGPLDMVVARVEAIVRDERQHQAKLEAKFEDLDKRFIMQKGAYDHAIKQLSQAEAELSNLRSLDRHKDKDWSKWYGLYNQKCERVVELEQQLAQLQQEKETLLKSMGVWELMEQKKKDIAQLQEALNISKDTANIEADRADRLQAERDKLQEENIRLKNLMGRTS